MDVVPEVEYKALKAQAKKHSQFETFRDEMLKLIESIWHHARMDGEIADPEEAGEDTQSEEVTPVAPVQSTPEEGSAAQPEPAPAS